MDHYTGSLQIDVACRAAHQASLADAVGHFVWTGRKFCTTVADLDQLWAMLPADGESPTVRVIMESTRNAWMPLAAWFRRQGAIVVMVPPEQSADLRSYYAKHQVRPAGLPAAGPNSLAASRAAA